MGRQADRTAESTIDLVLEGVSPQDALDDSLSAQCCQIREVGDTIDINFLSKGEIYLKTFFDGEGNLRFCTENDVLIDPSSDYRLRELMQFADALSVDSPLFDLFEQYEGTLDSLYKQVTDGFSLVQTIG